METIKQVLQDIKNKIEMINKEPFMVNNGLKISCRRSYVVTINNGEKDFFTDSTRRCKLCLYNFHSLCWIMTDVYGDNIPKNVIYQLLDNCGFNSSW